MEEQELLKNIVAYEQVARNLRETLGIVINPEGFVRYIVLIDPKISREEIYKGLEKLAEQGKLETIYLLPKENIPEERQDY